MILFLYYKWKAERYLAVDQGTIGPMIENYKTSFLEFIHECTGHATWTEEIRIFIIRVWFLLKKFPKDVGINYR